jgi:hypothetical protein
MAAERFQRSALAAEGFDGPLGAAKYCGMPMRSALPSVVHRTEWNAMQGHH